MLTAAPQTIAGRVGNAVAWEDAILPDYERELVNQDQLAHRTAFELEHGLFPAASFDDIAARLNCSRQLVCRLYQRAINKILQAGKEARQ